MCILFVFSQSPQRGKQQNKSDSRPDEGRKGRSPDRRRRGRIDESPKRMEIGEVMCSFGSHRSISTLYLFSGVFCALRNKNCCKIDCQVKNSPTCENASRHVMQMLDA